MGKLNYHYDEKTGEYLSNSPAEVDRLKTLAAKETIYFGPPRFATQIEPPAGVGECIFNPDGYWVKKIIPVVDPPKVKEVKPESVKNAVKSVKKTERKQNKN